MTGESQHRPAEVTVVDSQFGACSDKGGSGKAWGPEEGRGKRDDLWALGETEPRGYPSLSGREVREREKRGLDGRVWGAEGEGPNGPPNHPSSWSYFGCIYIVCNANVGQWGQILLSAHITVAVWQYGSSMWKIPIQKRRWVNVHLQGKRNQWTIVKKRFPDVYARM